ncbi:hypothetical protein ACQ4LE_000638 [Meloidogyne hapla]
MNFKYFFIYVTILLIYLQLFFVFGGDNTEEKDKIVSMLGKRKTPVFYPSNSNQPVFLTEEEIRKLIEDKKKRTKLTPKEIEELTKKYPKVDKSVYVPPKQG